MHSLLYGEPPDPVAILGGGALVLIVFVAIPLTLVALQPLLEGLGFGGPKPTPAPEIQVIEAHIARLGKKLDPKRLPDRDVPRLSTAPQDIAVSADAVPQDQPLQEPPKDAKDDPMKRLGDRAQAFAEIAEEREREGDPEGLAEGNAKESREGDLYGAKLGVWFGEGWDVATLIPKDELVKLRVEVSVNVSSDGKLTSYRILKPSGHTIFDQSVETQLLRLKGQALPTPPDSVKNQYWGQTIGFNYNGKDAD